MELKRRDFLRSAVELGVVSAAGTISTANGATNDSTVQVRRRCFSTDPTAAIPLTPSISCSRIGLGTGVHGGNRTCNLTRMDRNKAEDIFRCSYDNGIRLFDLADLYGTHELCRDALKGKPRDSYVISSKIWLLPRGLPESDRPSADVTVKRFLKELNTDYLDVVQIHCMTKADWPDIYKKWVDELSDLKEKGLIRAHGISTHSLPSLETAAKFSWVDTIHTRLNSVNTRMEGSWEENTKLIADAHNAGKGIIIMKVLGEGAIKDPAVRRQSLEKVLRFAGTDAMVVGFEAQEHITEFLDNSAAILKSMKENGELTA